MTSNLIVHDNESAPHLENCVNDLSLFHIDKDKRDAAG